MHEVTITEETRARILARRGRLHAHERIDPARTALLVIDMQKGFVAPGALQEVPAARGIIPNINRLVAAARAAGVPVVWVQFTAWEKDGETSWPAFYAHVVGAEFRARHLATMGRGGPGWDIAEGLDVVPSDMRSEKTRFSGFFPGTSDLDAQLRAQGRDTVMVTGTLTNRCCAATAEDAMNLGYGVIFVEDANATLSDEEHLSAITNVALAHGDLRRTDEVCAMLDDARAGAAG